MSNKLVKPSNGNSIFARGPFEIDHMINSLFGEFSDWWAPERQLGRPFQSTIANCSIIPEVGEDGSISLHIEVPGYDKEDLSISYNEVTSILTISSKTEGTSGKAKYKKTFDYRYSLKGYDPSTIEATCDKGILTIKASPKIEKENIRTIKIT